MTTEINKSESAGIEAYASLNRERGQPMIISSGRMINDRQKRLELDIYHRLDTFDIMSLDSAVYDAYTTTQDRVLIALASIKLVGKKDSKKSKRAADFLNYTIRNMRYGTWYDSMQDLITATKYGWSDLNIVMERRTYGKYSGSYCLAKLSPRDQRSVYGWLWNDSMTEWMGFVQRPSVKQRPSQAYGRGFENGLTMLSVPRYSDGNKWPVLRREQIVHAAYNSTLNNPQGDSPFMHFFDDWYEKSLIRAFEISGINKDLSGVPVLYVPSDLINKANQPDIYPDAAEEYRQLQEDAINITKGEDALIVLNNDRDARGERLIDFKLLGVEGGNKNYDTSAIILRKDKAIYNAFGAGHILLGQDGGGGSNALSSNQMTRHGHRINKDIKMYINILEHQLFPRILAQNGIYLDYEDMPEIEYDDFEPTSFDEFSKFVQRMKSVDGLTPEMMKAAAKASLLPIEGIDDIDFTSSGTSRAGDGMATAGQGTSTSVGGGDTSISNNENGGVNKTFVQDGKWIVDVETDKPLIMENE